MIYGGPVNKPKDVQFMYNDTEIMGYIGGSVFERIPSEQTIIEVTKSFKQTNDFHYDELIEKITDGIGSQADHVEFVKKYVWLNYMNDISLNEIADILRLSRPYLSTLFKKEVGVSFTIYLIDFRLNRAIEILKKENMGLTTKGTIGAQTALTLDDCVEKIQGIIHTGKAVNPDILVICHGGPIAEPEDAEYVIKRVDGIVGFFGASSIERFAAEKGIKEQSEAFKKIGK